MDNSRIGAPLDSITEVYSDYRFLVCGKYTVFYRVESNTIYVVRILYGRRDFMRILFGDVPDDESDSNIIDK